MAECFCRVGEIEICYETFGDAADPTLLLVMGLGTQMLGWDDAFCEALATRGLHVVRFDNRDIGRSTILDACPAPTLVQLLRRDRRRAAYTLAEMAADAVGLLDHLEIERAHLVGASMGGMIAQTIAARRPERVLTLTSIMSNTGSRWSGQPSLRAYRLFLRRLPQGREEYIDHAADLFRIIGSPGYDRDDDEFRALLGRMYDRGNHPASTARQLAAILASGDRTSELAHITAPTLVIHGSKDRLVAVSGGRATARAIPGARLLVIEGMGHDLPRGVWPQVIDAIADHTGRVSAPAARRAA